LVKEPGITTVAAANVGNSDGLAVSGPETVAVVVGGELAVVSATEAVVGLVN